MLTSLLLLASIVHAQSLTEPTSKDNSTECDCYVVSGPNPGYFQYYRFWDFRSIAGNFSIPALLTTLGNAANNTTTSPYFDTDQFNADWSIESGNNSGYSGSIDTMINSAQNVFLSRDESSFLALRASRAQDFVSTVELDSNQKNLLHASIRTRARVIPQDTTLGGLNPFLNPATSGVNSSHPVAPGACVGIFTYESDTEESDIEILTNDPTNGIHLTNQPDTDKQGNSIDGASSYVTIDDWTEWREFRIDWFPDHVAWYVDDEFVLNKTLNTPKKPSGLVLNVWSDGGSWSGNMSVGAQVVAGFEWVEMTFNISGSDNGPQKRSTQGCNVVCSLDNTTAVLGQPVVVFNSTDSGAVSVRGSVMGSVVFAVVLSLFTSWVL